MTGVDQYSCITVAEFSDADFFKAQDILEQRARKDESKRTISMTNKGKTLLNGNIYCAHCGCRLATTSYTERYTRKDGSLYEKHNSRYICYHRSRGLNDCDGATTYIAEKIDQCRTLRSKRIRCSKPLPVRMVPNLQDYLCWKMAS